MDHIIRVEARTLEEFARLGIRLEGQGYRLRCARRGDECYPALFEVIREERKRTEKKR